MKNFFKTIWLWIAAKILLRLITIIILTIVFIAITIIILAILGKYWFLLLIWLILVIYFNWQWRD
jgi:hypothetical protein